MICEEIRRYRQAVGDATKILFDTEITSGEKLGGISSMGMELIIDVYRIQARYSKEDANEYLEEVFDLLREYEEKI